MQWSVYQPDSVAPQQNAAFSGPVARTESYAELCSTTPSYESAECTPSLMFSTRNLPAES